MDWLLDYYNFRIVGQYADVFVAGVLQTLWISALCLVFSLVLGTALALARMSPHWAIWRTAADRKASCRERV